MRATVTVATFGRFLIRTGNLFFFFKLLVFSLNSEKIILVVASEELFNNDLRVNDFWKDNSFPIFVINHDYLIAFAPIAFKSYVTSKYLNFTARLINKIFYNFYYGALICTRNFTINL